MSISSEQVLSSLTAFSRIGAYIVATVGGIVLVGWVLGIDSLKSVAPGFVTMKVNTALALFVSGIALRLVTLPEWRRSPFTRILALGIAAVGGLTIIEYIFDLNLGIDQLLMADDPGSPHTSHPGRMAPATALNFLLVGLALTFRYSVFARARIVVQWCAVSILLIASLAVIGYAFGVRPLYGVAPYTSMAIHTALAFCVLALAILAATPTAGIMMVVTSDTAGGFVARRLLVLIPVGLFFMGGACLAGQKMGWYDGTFGLALMVLQSMVFSAVLVLWHAKVLYSVDLRRIEAEAGLERKVQERTAELESALREVNELQDLLPICAWCKKIRDDQDFWRHVDDYVVMHTRTRVSHGICPQCVAKIREKSSQGSS